MENLTYHILTTNSETGKRRGANARAQLDEIGQDYTEFVGIHHSDPDWRDLTIYDPYLCKGANMSPGQICAAMSHALLWSKFLKESKEGEIAIILEDDFHFYESQDCLTESMANLPHEWDFAVLHGWGLNDMQRASWENDHWWQVTVCPWVLVGYALSQAGARKFLHNVFPIREVADAFTRRVSSQVNAYQIKTPWVNANYELPSSIDE